MRIRTISKARKPGMCEACGKTIEVGQGYRSIKPRYGAKRKRHLTCPVWTRSEMTTNDKLSALYAAIESAEGDIAAWGQEWLSAPVAEDAEAMRDELTAVLSQAAESVREVAEMYRESASNIEEGFGHATSLSEDMENNADEVESFADDIETTDLPDIPELDTEMDEWIEEAREAAQEALSGCPL